MGKGGNGASGLAQYENYISTPAQDGTLGGGGGGGARYYYSASDLTSAALQARGGNGGNGYVKIQWGA